MLDLENKIRRTYLGVMEFNLYMGMIRQAAAAEGATALIDVTPAATVGAKVIINVDAALAPVRWGFVEAVEHGTWTEGKMGERVECDYVRIRIPAECDFRQKHMSLHFAQA